MGDDQGAEHGEQLQRQLSSPCRVQTITSALAVQAVARQSI
jgi:hypothetical protein